MRNFIQNQSVIRTGKVKLLPVQRKISLSDTRQQEKKLVSVYGHFARQLEDTATFVIVYQTFQSVI